MKKWLLNFMLCAFICLPRLTLDAEVQAQSSFDPSIIRAGEVAMYSIMITSTSGNAQLESLSTPSVEGLEMNYAGSNSGTKVDLTSQGFSRTSQQVYMFQVRAQKPGEYTVPAFQLTVNGQPLEVPAANIKVLEGSAPTTGDNPAIITEVELPRETFYVGEAVLAKVKLILDPNRVTNVSQLRDTPFIVKEGDAFTIGKFGNLKSRDIEYKGRIMREHSWQVVITPLKTGVQNFVLQSDWQITTNEGSDAQRRYRSPLDHFFASPFQRQHVTLYTDDANIDIQPLPLDGQPTHFTGGIGVFSVDQPRLSQKSTLAGEPLTMTLTVRGQGNFDRLQAPVLLDQNQWRDYPPEEEYSAADDLRYTGYKTFEYTLIPNEPGELTTPEIDFNFFDPVTAQYVEMPIPGVSISVAENPNAQRPAPRNPVAARRGPELLPIATSPGAWVGSITPIITNPVFLAAQSIPALLIGFLFLSRRREQRLENDAEYARGVFADRAIKGVFNEAKSAALEKDANAFYTAALKAVQVSAARYLEQTAGSITVADVEALAARINLDEESLNAARDFMETGDAIRFGGIATAQVDFDTELKRLETTIQAFGGKR